jgi:hypothetical protein
MAIDKSKLRAVERQNENDNTSKSNIRITEIMTNIAIAITLMASYIVILCAIYRKIPNSLSQSVFMIPPHASWLWTVTIAGTAALIMPTLLDKTDSMWQFLAFFACTGLALTGLCPLSPNKDKTDLNYKAHMTGAWMSAVCSQLLVAVTNFWLMALWIPWIAVLVFLESWYGWRTKAFWAEMTCFATIFILLLS